MTKTLRTTRTRSARKPRVELTAGQKAARTKRRMGLLITIARKAARTRKANLRAQVRTAKARTAKAPASSGKAKVRA